jgi:hypothetical protein
MDFSSQSLGDRNLIQLLLSANPSFRVLQVSSKGLSFSTLLNLALCPLLRCCSIITRVSSALLLWLEC